MMKKNTKYYHSSVFFLFLFCFSLLFFGHRADAQHISTEKTTQIATRWQLDRIEMSIYPNPTRGNKINIKAEGCRQGRVNLILYNAIGSVIWQHTVIPNTKGNIDFPLYLEDAWANGLYFLSVSEKEQRTMKKLIINR